MESNNIEGIGDDGFSGFTYAPTSERQLLRSASLISNPTDDEDDGEMNQYLSESEDLEAELNFKAPTKAINDNEDDVDLTRREVIDEHKTNNDFIPLDTVMSDLARRAIMGNQIKSLNLSGVEQLTDMFFYILKQYEVNVQNLETLNLTGCSSISDIAIKWVVDYIPSLQVLIFNSIQLNSTSISAVSPKMNINVIGLLGCPLISPPTDTYRRNVKSDPSVSESLGAKITNVSNTKKAGLRVWKNWKPKEDKQCTFNVYEVIVGSGYEGLVLSNGQIVIIPYSEDDTPTSKHIAKQILTILCQFPESVFVLYPVKELKSDSMENKVNEELKEWESRIRLTLESFTTQKYTLEEHKYHDQIIFTSGQSTLESLQQKHMICPPSPSKPNSVDFDFLCNVVEKLKTVFPWHAIGYFKETLQIVKTMPGMGLPPVTMGELYRQIPDDSKFVLNTRSEYAAHAEISKALELMNTRGLCLYFPELQDSPVVGDVTTLQEFLGDLLQAKAPHSLPIKGLGESFPCWTENDLKKLAKGRIRLLLKVLEHFGIIMAIPCDCRQINSDDSYVYILTKDLPEISPELVMVCFTYIIINTFSEGTVSLNGHPAMLFPMYLSLNDIILRKKKDLKMKGQMRRFRLLLLLNIVMIDRNNNINCNSQLSVMFDIKLMYCILLFVLTFYTNNLSKIVQFSLLWKTGAVFHQGPITILVELSENGEGTPAIVVSTRMQAPVKNKTLKHLVEDEDVEDFEEENEANEEKTIIENNKQKDKKKNDNAKFWVSLDNVPGKMLWYTFNNVTNVLDCILQKYKIYATKTVPCNGCLPTGNRYTALQKYTADRKQKENVVYFYRTLSIQGGPIKVHCSNKDTNPVVNREIFIGPKIQKSIQHVPNHYGDTVQTQEHKFVSTIPKENDIEEKEKNTRCFLCQNCCVNGIECKQNYKNDSISRRCACKKNGDLCIHCGICSRCVHTLAESYSTVYPSFLPQKVASDKVNRTGSLISYMDQNAQYEFKDFLSYEYFNHIKICLLRGAFLSIGFVDYSGGESILHTKYDTEFGNFTTEGDVLQEGAKCKEGDLLEIQVVSVSSDISEISVQIKLNQGVIHFMQLPSRKTKLSCIAKRPAVISVQTPGLMSMVSEPEKMSISGVKGYESSWFTPCSGYLPTIPEVKITQMLRDVEWYLFRNYRVDFMANSRDMILASQSTMLSRFIHFTNAEGYVIDDEIGIPPLDRLFPEIAKSSLPVQAIETGVREMLRLQMLRLYLCLGESFSINAFKKVTHLDSVSLELLENLEDNFPSCGLHKTESDLITNKILYLCESHKNAWSINQDVVQVPPDFFSGHAHFIANIHLSQNQLVSLPEKIFAELKNLLVFHISDNFIEEIPKSIAHCKKLMSLDLNENNLTDLPESLAECTNLYRLDISSNLMEKIPPVVTKITSLERLMCSNMMLTEFPEDIGNLKNLKILYALGNCFSKLPKSFVELQKLEELGLMGVAWFKVKAKTLVSKQKFEEFLQSRNDNTPSGFPPEILELKNLKYLSLQYQGLELDECPLLKTPPKEIRDRGLVRALMSDENKTSLTGAEAITDGIDICTWKVPHENESISYSVWDFAGQTVYYNTHQFFLSNRAVYFLLWNVRLGFEHSGLNFWLSSISVHAPKAPIFVVGTHVDQVSKVELPTEEMKQTYPQIKGFFFVSSYTGQGLSNLKSELINATLEEKYMGEKIPGAWLDLENAVLKKKEKDKIDVMNYSAVETLANKSGIVDKVEIAQAVQFLHDLGALQHFTNEYLKSREGRLKHVDKAKIWADYPQEYHDWLLRLTEEYDLTFPLPGENANLVPCLLPEKKPKINWPEISKESNLRDLKIAYKFDYLPAGLFNRGQVRLHQFSDSSLMWKRGSFLKKNEHICLIQQFLKDPHMFLASTVRRAIELKAPFLQCLKYFHAITVEELQASMPPDTSSDFDVHLVHAVSGLKDLRRSMALDMFCSYCPKNCPKDKSDPLHPVFIDMTEKKRSVYQDKFKDLLKKLNEMMNQALGASKETPECFISYCWANSATANGLFEDITKGLLNARVMIACVSDEYAESVNCMKEFSYAIEVLQLPIVVAVVGSGHSWKMTKVGFLSLMYPIVNFQKKNKDAHENLLDYVKEYLAKDQGNKKLEEKKKQKDKENEKINKQSFQGWHSVSEPLMLPEDFTPSLLEEFAPYLSRITVIMKHSSELVLNCLTDPDGHHYTTWLDKTSASILTGFESTYHKFRQHIIDLDKDKTMGKLQRCRLPSGKTIWLCEEHISKMRVTVMSNEEVTTEHIPRSTVDVDYMTDALRKLDHKSLAIKFHSSKKSKRRPIPRKSQLVERASALTRENSVMNFFPDLKGQQKEEKPQKINEEQDQQNSNKYRVRRKNSNKSNYRNS
ncbi:hypothetical protein KUTeg_018574 [Tegillarca granosa]|uniref:Roc domain-containing protein n=1 Tax=Tegillarca granosa TaxID=220873 RepID=A0ABQ9EM80_TEGGR|nr:hypothetical protein KUTeg_018574 [Tegillarca granosa]